MHTYLPVFLSFVIILLQSINTFFSVALGPLRSLAQKTLNALDVGALPINGTADTALKDKNGNDITETYLTKTEFDSTIGDINSVLDSINRVEI